MAKFDSVGRSNRNPLGMLGFCTAFVGALLLISGGCGGGKPGKDGLRKWCGRHQERVQRCRR